jgi:hypothetical protein
MDIRNRTRFQSAPGPVARGNLDLMEIDPVQVDLMEIDPVQADSWMIHLAN